MNEDFLPGDDEAEDEDFIITNLGSVGELDESFRPDEHYLARGPFRVHSPAANQWTWGYRLEQAGKHLVFQDGSALGRTVMSDGMSMRASNGGSIIWLFGFEDDGLTVLTLSVATLEDYRAAAPDDVAISNFDDGARVVMAELETKRRAKFGLDFECVLTSRIAIVFRDITGSPVQGLFYFDRFGGIHSRVDGRWLRCTFSEDGPERGDGELLLSPTLKSGVALFDALQESEGPLSLKLFQPYIYPKFDTDDSESWSYLFDDWEIVD